MHINKTNGIWNLNKDYQLNYSMREIDEIDK